MATELTRNTKCHKVLLVQYCLIAFKHTGGCFSHQIDLITAWSVNSKSEYLKTCGLNKNPGSTSSFSSQHYVDGAASDNLPRCHLVNTTTISPYAGESDLCPRSSSLTFNEVRFNNVSIQVNSENLYRVTSTFFPPEPQVRQENDVTEVMFGVYRMRVISEVWIIRIFFDFI